MTARRMKSLFLTVFAGLSLLIPVCVLGDSTPIAWSTQANHLKLGPGKSMLVTCPAKGQIVPRLWGTDIYTDDSSICTAAVHAGLINTASGGTVLVEGLGGQPSYSGSQRNGLNSGNYGGWGGSFTVKPSVSASASPPVPSTPVASPSTSAVDWGTQANHLKLGPGKSMLVTCPAKGQIVPRLWGTDIYTDDSSICTAAVHAGLINTASGGAVQVEGLAGQSSYRDSQRNGVSSRSYGAWSGSFTVKAPTGKVITPPPSDGNKKMSCEPSGSGTDRGVSWLWYSLISTSKGVQECHMGHHTFCAMASSQQGTAKSLCFVGQNLGDWILKAVVESDPNGTHQCSAVCMDIRGFGIE